MRLHLSYRVLLPWVAALTLLCLPVPAEAAADDPSPEATAPSARPSEPETDARPSEPETSLKELLQRVASLEEVQAERELDELRRVASSEAAAAEAAPQEESSNPVFTSGARSLQALNPEISLTADAGARLAASGTDPGTLAQGSGLLFRQVGIHFEANLDPYSYAKIAVPITPDGAALGEAYATWVSVLPGLSLTLGKFRQQLGVVNRWHVPSLDQFDQPLALTTLIGPSGLAQIGTSLEYKIPPLLADAHTLTVQVTNGMNGHLFSGHSFGVPVGLAHLRNYWDLSESTYLEVGLTGVWGTNDRRGVTLVEDVQVFDQNGDPVMRRDAEGNVLGPLFVPGESVTVDEPWRETWVGGLDVTVSWVPLRRERYSGITSRSEVFAVSKEVAGGRLQALGGYSYVDARLSQQWVVGVRGDLTQPFALENEGDWDWGVSPYVTWWQSAWVRLRLQGTHLRLHDGRIDNRLVLQAVMSVGPHKHERY